jgi:hypothetical protein
LIIASGVTERFAIVGSGNLSAGGLELNEHQERTPDAAISGKPVIDHRLGTALTTIAWPCHYLDFETVSTFTPLYEGHGCARASFAPKSATSSFHRTRL